MSGRRSGWRVADGEWMSGKSITRLLLVEDDPGAAALLRSMFNERRSPGTEFTHAAHMRAAEEHLAEHSVDVILLDLGLPDAEGLEAVRRIRAAAPRTPLVVLTGLDDDSLALQALQEGAQDYLIKGQIEPRGVLRALRYAVERKSIEEELFQEKQHAQVMLNCIGEAVVCTDVSGNITFLNLVAKNMSGWSWQEAAGRPMAETLRIVDATSRRTIDNPMAIATGNRAVQLPSNCILIRHDGVEIPIEDSGSSIYHRDGHAAGAVIVFHDVSAVRAMSLELTYSAQHDYLTGLPNRLLLNDRIHQAIAQAPRHKKQVALLFLDLDGFKHINDSLGHPIGDKLLQSIARRLVNCVRASDTVSRQGGDEFVVLLSEPDQWEDIAVAARRMLHAVAEVHSIDQHDLHVTTSIGVSVFPDDGLDAETLIRNADTAMYQAKENGRQSCQFFRPEMNARAVERQSIEESLRRALERKELVLYYQPKVNLRTGAITGAEALIRWTHPVRGLICPAQFIPIAEDCGLILPIGKWVLREACRQARAWVDAGLPVTTMAVNVSSMELQQENFLAGLFSILDETSLDPGFLELELTESVLMEYSESAASILQALREKGVQVAIDDFGTGYSSLSYLRKFPVDALKIDQSFVSHISTAGDNASIVTAVISMARSLKLRVVAEGVETLEELAFLQTQQCDEGQGFYFSRPVPPEQFAALLQRGLLETVAAEDLERRIVALERELAERDRRTEKAESESARLRKVVDSLEGANRTVVPLNVQTTSGQGPKLHVQQQD
jgi:diguanylate cyclase (GGDEF)-like protein/PAS domain S-box-containing protein